jgi:predicted metal-dependent peptidase
MKVTGKSGALPSTPWTDLFATGLARAVGAAVDVAGGAAHNLADDRPRKTRWRLALDWFVSSYPLLGALADAFKLVEDPKVCRTHRIRIAAISPAAAELYVNPACGLEDDGEYRFVIAHELLHAGLRHDTRSGGRDAWLWNVACDYVINGWLSEMAVGELPSTALYDPALRGMSAEQVYDKIAADRRRLRKLATMRGYELPDILPQPLERDAVRGVDLDEFYRRCLTDGIRYHRAYDRGLLPSGLIEEIYALAQPPVPWDVELARWFDEHFEPLERRRSYARASRRQAATPDIARPGWYVPPEAVESRTFGVVLDTSGSMDVRLLGKALGAIASYAVAREVHRVRVVFCDAEAHDNGWMPPLDIAGRVRVRGRGGTVLQPGVDLLAAAADFPKDGPILVITDGWCDRVHISREHAFLIPAGESLPFHPRGPVFRFS